MTAPRQGYTVVQSWVFALRLAGGGGGGEQGAAVSSSIFTNSNQAYLSVALLCLSDGFTRYYPNVLSTTWCATRARLRTTMKVAVSVIITVPPTNRDNKGQFAHNCPPMVRML